MTRGRSQPCHAFTEPGGYTRSQEDTKKIQFDYRRNRADTTGHGRTRCNAGSGPFSPGFKSRAPDQRCELGLVFLCV
jgi:hypothetical protein